MRSIRHLLRLCLVTLFLASGCEQRLTVYADPWLSGFAEQVVDRYGAEHPDVRIDLRILSSEVVAWHIRYGQPVDVFLCFGPALLDSLGIRDQVRAEMVLGDEQMALVAGQDQGKWAGFKTEDCLVLEASNRPGRRYADAWMHSPSYKAAAGCEVYAGFQSQIQDYLLRGWVPRGIVPLSMAQRLPGSLETLDSGPVISNAYMAFKMKQNRRPALADDFFQYIQTEKSRGLLAAEHLFP